MNRSDVVNDTRLSGLVDRYHTWPTLTRQNVAEHSWQVLRIYIEMFGPPSPDVSTHITYHDSPELVTGDPPFPVKQDNPELKSIYDGMELGVRTAMNYPVGRLTPDEMNRVKVCDLLEMWEFGRHEMNMGNRYAEPIVRDTLVCALERARQLPPEDRQSVDNFVYVRENR